MRRALFLLAASLLPSAAGARARQTVAPPQSLHDFLAARNFNAWQEMRRSGPERFLEYRYVAAFVDLNGDGRREAVVHENHSGCGTGGCGIAIYTPRGRSWRLVCRTSIGHAPIRLLPGRHHGWRDLGVLVAGGGAVTHEARLAFNGSRYPYNPSVPPAVPLRAGTPGRMLIGRNDPGRILFRAPARANRN